MDVENCSEVVFILGYDFYLVVFDEKMENLVDLKNINLEKSVSKVVS